MDWVDLGTFHAVDERRVQQFPLETHVYAKYIKVMVVNPLGINMVTVITLACCKYTCIKHLSLSLSLSLSLFLYLSITHTLCTPG